MYLEQRMDELEARLNRLEGGKEGTFKEEYLTVREVARSLFLSEATVRRRIHEGTIKAVTMFGRFRIPKSQFLN